MLSSQCTQKGEVRKLSCFRTSPWSAYGGGSLDGFLTLSDRNGYSPPRRRPTRPPERLPPLLVPRPSPLATRLQDALDGLLQPVLGLDAGEALDHLAVLEDAQQRDT